MLDPVIIGFDRALRTLFATSSTTRRVPGEECPEPALSLNERAHAGALMRINHVGEVCAQARKSLLNPLWYLGALSLGVFAGKLGDATNLGFLAATERQVEAHLNHHLSELPVDDVKSRAIVHQMKLDEISHAETAVRLGARELPPQVVAVMRLAAGLMTRTAYYV